MSKYSHIPRYWGLKIQHVNFKKLSIYFLLPCIFIAACKLSLVALSRGHPLVVVDRLLIAVASLVAEHGL